MDTKINAPAFGKNLDNIAREQGSPVPGNPYVYSYDCCQSSHMLRNLDRDNFGQLYNNKALSKNSRTFLPICRGCLLAKFGLVEQVAKSSNNLQCYYNRKTQNQPCAQEEEGPFLRAYKITDNIYERNVVFAANTLILPAGQLLLDTLMMDPDELFSGDINTIQYRLNAHQRYFLNNYLYLYFKMLHEKYVCHVNVRIPQVSDTNSFNELQFKSLHHMIRDGYTSVGYQCDAFLFGNLINPRSGMSTYINAGEKITFGPKRIIDVRITATAYGSHREPILNEASVYAKTDIINPTKPIPVRQMQALRNFSNMAFAKTNNMQNFIHNRKESLKNYFLSKVSSQLLDKPQSAIGLHVAHLCMPHIIVDVKESGKEEKSLRELRSNVTWIEGFGLVSTREICNNDFLVIDQATSIDNYMSMKGSAVGNRIRYNYPPDQISNHGQCELRRSPLPRQMYYAGL